MIDAKKTSGKNEKVAGPRRTHQLLIEQKRLLELIASGEPLEKCLSALCEAMPRLNPGVRASVLVADKPCEKFKRPIAPDLLPSFSKGLEGAPINSLAIGTSGAAVCSGEPVICENTESDEKWSKEWRDLCVQHGVLACHSTPIFDKNGKTLGSFMLCFSEPRKSNEWEYRLAEFGTHIASVALERDRSARSVNESENRFRTIVDQALAGVVETDEEGRMTLVNRRWCEMLGYSEEELLGKKALDVTHPASKEITVEAVNDLKEGDSDFTIEKRYQRKDGSVLWGSSSVSALRDENNNFKGFIAVIVDISNRIRQEKDLARMTAESEKQKRLYETIFSNTPDLTYVFDLNYRVIYVNDAVLNMWGRTLEESIGKSLLEVGYEAWQAEMHEREIDKAIETKQPVRGEIPFQHAELGERIYDYIFTPVVNNRDKVEAIVCTTRDVTERKQREKTDRFLVKLNDTLRPLANPEKIKAEAARVLGEHLDASRVFYAESETDEAYISFEQDYVNDMASIAGRYRLDDFGADLMDELRKGNLLAISDVTNYETEPRLKEVEPEADEAVNVRAYAAIPLVKKGYLVAYLGIHQSKPREWTKDEITLMEETAERTWAAVEHARAERALTENEKKYRTLFESMDEGYFIVEVLFDEQNNPFDYRFVEANPRFEELTGLSYKEELKGKTLREVLPDLEEKWFEIYAKIVETGKPMRFEEDSKVLGRSFDVYAYRIDADKQHLAILYQDITERKKREKLNKFLTHLERTLQSINDPDEVMATTARMLGEYLEVDRCAYAEVEEDENYFTIPGDYTRGDTKSIVGQWPLSAFGSKELLLMRKNHTFVVDNVDTDEHLADEENTSYERGQIKSFIRVPLKKKGKLAVSVAVHQRTPRKWSSDEVELARTVAYRCWEAIERARATKNLQKMNETLEDKVKERTSALLSYQEQLRNLATRLSRTEEEERRRLATELHDNLGQLLAVCKMKMNFMEKTGNISNMSETSDLVEDALVYTRKLMSDLKPPPSLGKEDISKNLFWLANKMKKHGLVVKLKNNEQSDENLDENFQTILVQCVREALFNVVKHANVDEALVALSYPDNHIKIAIEDEGKGFDVKNNKPDLSKGGFGLFNIKERIDLLGGQVDILSEPGEGTKVEFLVPLKEKESDTLPHKQEKGKESGATKNKSKIKVLLVDDHEMMREGLKKIIEEENDLTVIAEAPNGRKAIKLAHETQPDVILMDINLPGMNGIDTTERIKSELPEVCIIGLSLHNDEEVAREMRNVGASAYLNKSNAFETLCATIRSEAMK